MWLSLARAPGLGPGGRRFESCHPDLQKFFEKIKKLKKQLQFIKKYVILTFVAGCGSAWLERLVWDQEVAGSNPVTPTTDLSVMQECRNWQTSKTKDLVSNALVWVQVPSPAVTRVEGFQEKAFGFFYFYKNRPVGQAVKTSPSHGGVRGSIPLRVTDYSCE